MTPKEMRFIIFNAHALPNIHVVESRFTIVSIFLYKYNFFFLNIRSRACLNQCIEKNKYVVFYAAVVPIQVNSNVNSKGF